MFLFSELVFLPLCLFYRPTARACEAPEPPMATNAPKKTHAAKLGAQSAALRVWTGSPYAKSPSGSAKLAVLDVDPNLMSLKMQNEVLSGPEKRSRASICPPGIHAFPFWLQTYIKNLHLISRH